MTETDIDGGGAERAAAAGMPGRRREEWAVALFGTWMMTGLFLDGWAHEAEKPETFFSPWHGILYSGFVAAVLWFAWDGRRAGRGATPTGELDSLTTVGLGLFVAGAVGDGLWHEIFGVEADLEALVSPSHLALFFGGLLMVSSPLRMARDRRRTPDSGGPPRVTWGEWLPQAVTLTLVTALVAFFTQYLSPFEGVGLSRPFDADVRELEETHGVASVLAFNSILIAALLFAVRRWRPPLGSATLLFGAVAVGMAGLEGFELAELALPAIAAGLVVDALVVRSVRPHVIVAAGSLVLWGGFFAVAEISFGLAWSVELWSGSIVLAVASSLLLASVITEPAARR